jgi:hypothetical protein
MSEEATRDAASKELPPGDYCIVEFFGHTTMVGRYAEVERFGTKMLALEPMFKGELLPVIFHGGSSIYRLTPCSPEIALKRAPDHEYHLPPAVRCIVPPAMLPAPSTVEHEGDPDFEEVEADMDPAFNDEAETN